MNSQHHSSMIQQIQEWILDPTVPQVIPVGGNTKNALAAVSEQHQEAATVPLKQLPMRELSGILAYQPSEFLITALAGTTIQDIESALAENGQYLPFDPLFTADGATLGGTIASGISGPGSMLYGTVRDFVMEVELVDGLAQLCRGGGKVVKNAAGFDLPKMVCGGYGRIGVLTEVTVKVLPRPEATVCLETQLKDFSGCIQAIQQLRLQPLPINSLSTFPGARLQLQLAGPAQSLDKVIQRVKSIVKQDWSQLSQGESTAWMQRQPWLIRAAIDLEQLPRLATALEGIGGAFLGTTFGGGSVAWIGLEGREQLDLIDKSLQELQCAGVVVRGPVDELTCVGDRRWIGLAQRIQAAVDPHGRFAPLPNMTRLEA